MQLGLRSPLHPAPPLPICPPEIEEPVPPRDTAFSHSRCFRTKDIASARRVPLRHAGRGHKLPELPELPELRTYPRRSRSLTEQRVNRYRATRHEICCGPLRLDSLRFICGEALHNLFGLSIYSYTVRLLYGIICQLFSFLWGYLLRARMRLF